MTVFKLSCVAIFVLILGVVAIYKFFIEDIKKGLDKSSVGTDVADVKTFIEMYSEKFFNWVGSVKFFKFLKKKATGTKKVSKFFAISFIVIVTIITVSIFSGIGFVSGTLYSDYGDNLKKDYITVEENKAKATIVSNAKEIESLKKQVETLKKENDDKTKEATTNKVKADTLEKAYQTAMDAIAKGSNK